MPLAIAAACGFLVAAYLAAVQAGLLARAWDPVFGPASAGRVLHSAFSRALPVPDAALGAVAYAVEVALALAGGEARWRTRPGTVLAYGAVAAALAAGSVVLVLLQVAVIRAGCTLCLLSAVISFGVAAAAAAEVRAAWHVVRGRHVHQHA